MYDINKTEISEEQFTKKIKTHKNSNIFLISLWLLVILIFKISSIYLPSECAANFGFGASGHGCVTGISIVLGFFILILFVFSIVEGFNGIKLLKKVNSKIFNKDTKILKLTSYILLIPLFLLLFTGIYSLFFLN